MKITVLNPIWLFAILVICFLCLFIYRKKKVKSGHTKKLMIYSMLAMIFVVLSLAGFEILEKEQSVSTVFVVDVSDSVKMQKSEMESFIQKAVDGKNKWDEYGVVAVGKDGNVDTFLTNKKDFSQITSTNITTATNLEAGLKAALGMFQNQSAKRIVLLTDGQENQGTIQQMEGICNSQNVEVKVVDYSKKQQDAYIDHITVPGQVHINDDFNLSVTVKSNVNTKSKLSLYRDDRLVKTEQVQLQEGENNYTFTLKESKKQSVSYRAEIEPEEDYEPINNEYLAVVKVETPPKVLLLEGKASTKQFQQLLTNANVNFEVADAEDAPKTIDQWQKYRSVITLNVNYKNLGQEAANGLKVFVQDYGGGYIAIGGDDSYVLGGYRKTPLEEILPVDMDLKGEKKVPKTSMLMILDHSGSMCGSEKEEAHQPLTLAKEAAVGGVAALRPEDEVGVLSFDDKFSWVVPFTKVQNAQNINEEIRSISGGGGTNIFNALKEGVEKMKKSDASIKHIILLTDGQDGKNRFGSLIEDAKNNKITISTVAVGNSTDQKMLSSVASQSGGRFYIANKLAELPRIFAQEVFLSSKAYLQNETFVPAIVNETEVLEPVLKEGLPKFYGYIATSEKKNATVLLQTPKEDPLLCCWQYGLGKTYAFTSDGTFQWTKDCANSKTYIRLWKNIINDSITDTSLGSDELNVNQEGQKLKIHYETKDYMEQTNVTATAAQNAKQKESIALNQVKPGVFEGYVKGDGEGVYAINIQKKEKEKVVKLIDTAMAIQYSQEYKTDTEHESLDHFVKMTNGAVIQDPSQVFTKKSGTKDKEKKLDLFFFALAIFFFALEMIVRRLQIDYLERVLYRIGKRLKRKKKVKEKTVPKQNEKQPKKKIEKTKKRKNKYKESIQVNFFKRRSSVIMM